jgi:hypothetical protein
MHFVSYFVTKGAQAHLEITGKLLGRSTKIDSSANSAMQREFCRAGARRFRSRDIRHLSRCEFGSYFTTEDSKHNFFVCPDRSGVYWTLPEHSFQISQLKASSNRQMIGWIVQRRPVKSGTLLQYAIVQNPRFRIVPTSPNVVQHVAPAECRL